VPTAVSPSRLTTAAITATSEAKCNATASVHLIKIQDGDVIDDFVPRPKTGFQVKKPDMSRADLEEMRPNGTLRPAIRDLADPSGAYIIVCS